MKTSGVAETKRAINQSSKFPAPGLVARGDGLPRKIVRVHAAVLNRPDFHQGVSHLEDVVEPVFFATDDEVILGARPRTTTTSLGSAMPIAARIAW